MNIDDELSVLKSLNDDDNAEAIAGAIRSLRVVFNIKGNSYRLVAKINYSKSWLFIRFIGSHKEYDKINAEEI